MYYNIKGGIKLGKIVIGLTGPFGSGCTYIAQNIIKKLGYDYVSLSEILKNKISNDSLSRTELQQEGNKLRSENGCDYLAKQAIETIKDSPGEKFVVDSIRNTHEVEALKSEFSDFYLFSTWADKETRWDRISKKYNNNRSAFDEDDKKDKDEKIENGQQITLCYQMSDIIILNTEHIVNINTDSFKKLNSIVNKYINIIEGNEKFMPSEQETLMSMAYANSMRSSCKQRKVGALIVDEYANVFSSGYNEVPNTERPCLNQYGDCYRKYLRKEINDSIENEIKNPVLSKKVTEVVKNKSKMLDYCRALHAEETAIVNMARLSVSVDLSKSTLYTTTYPCNLCANKIAQVGIKKIVYFDPYPQDEAKTILNSSEVKQIPFEGVTFNGYFRFMEVLR